jgi:hypothetical protein
MTLLSIVVKPVNAIAITPVFFYDNPIVRPISIVIASNLLNPLKFLSLR